MRARPHQIRPTVRRPWRLLAAGLLLLLLAAACSGDDQASDTARMSGTDDAGGDSAAFAPGGEARDVADAEEAEAAADAEAPAGDVGDDAADSPLPPVQTGTAATGERIIKEGTVTLVVEPGQFDTAFSQVVTRAQELGGHVAGTASSTDPAPGPEGEDGQVLTSGQVTIRIPVAAFESLLTAVGDAGTITERAVTSQDVTAEYTDLESRRRNLQAQERFYLGLLDQAQTIEDAIAVQQRLEDLQGQIEELTGRLNLLADRTAFSTLTVRIAEQGAEEAVAGIDGAADSGFAPYLRQVVGTFLLPFIAIGLIAVMIWRAVRPRRRTTPVTADASTPPAAEQPVAVGVGGVGSAGDEQG
jgi:hypothetical protein